MTFDFRSPILAFFLGLFAVTSVATTAIASPCSDASAARQVARTISAIRQAERRRQCRNGGGFFGGFFDGCSNLAYQRRQLSSDLSYLQRSGRACGRQTDEGRATARRRDRAEPRRDRDTSSRTVTGSPAILKGAAARMYCVRRTDGYFFPAPNSQFAGPETYDETLARCQFICDDQKMEVYFLPNASDETDDLVAISDQTAYSALATAFSYQKAKDFKSCDMQRYYRRMQAIEKARAKPAREPNNGTGKRKDAQTPSVIVVPRAKPERLADGTFADVRPDAGLSRASGERRVRIIGAPFMPQMQEMAETIRR